MWGWACVRESMWIPKGCAKRMKTFKFVCVSMQVLEMHVCSKNLHTLQICFVNCVMRKCGMYLLWNPVCMHACVHPSDPPHLPPRDGLSWMLMFCDGCGANKCFWHSTGSHYRSRPNGLACALMSRQVSQPQPLYQSHTLLMQGKTSTLPQPEPGKYDLHCRLFAYV